jgi:hypothetical protein
MTLSFSAYTISASLSYYRRSAFEILNVNVNTILDANDPDTIAYYGTGNHTLTLPLVTISNRVFQIVDVSGSLAPANPLFIEPPVALANRLAGTNQLAMYNPYSTVRIFFHSISSAIYGYYLL